ncbi:MAG TPA: GAF domain-containing sensor histidine kinase [Gemmatimonadales bacterium]|jgi:signal transduction histidine kinase
MSPLSKLPPDDARLRLEALVRTLLTVHAEHTLEAVLQRVADAARELTGAKYAALGVLAPGGKDLSKFITSGISPSAHAKIGTLPTGLGVLGVLITDPKPLRLADIGSHPKAHGFPAHHPPMKSFLGVPVVGRLGLFGNLYLTDKQGAAEFSDADEAITRMLAAQAAVAVENARLHDDSARLLTELKELQVSRDRFYAMINHELRNALTGVYGWADLLVRKGGDVPRAALEVHDAAEQTLGLVNDLLDISRLEAQRLKPVIRHVDAWELVDEAVRTVEPAAKARGITIEMSGKRGEMGCETDGQRVRQILVNLLANAIRHNPDHKPIQLEVKIEKAALRFDVVDTGEGIALEQQSAIFDAFVQADSNKQLGTGLGLTLSRRLARLLGGDLRVESRPGAGSRFILDLPRYSPVS